MLVLLVILFTKKIFDRFNWFFCLIAPNENWYDAEIHFLGNLKSHCGIFFSGNNVGIVHSIK